MKYNEDIFISQFPIAKRFLYHIVYYRELHKAYETSGLESEFWAHTIDAHLLQAAIQWCMIFGSDGCQATHWKKLSIDEATELENSFKKGLFEQTGLTPNSWDNYWSEMNAFRNQYAAHREIVFNNPVPNFSTAIEVVLFYDYWVRKIIFPDYMKEPPLENSMNVLSNKFKFFALSLINRSKDFHGI